MTKQIKQTLMIILGWICVLLGILGLLLPLMPGMLFMIIALFLFARSSERFHQMLLDSRWVGKDLRQWQEKKSISQVAFRKAATVIILSFAVSIALLNGRIGLQIMLLCIAVILLAYLWRISERPEKPVAQDQ